MASIIEGYNYDIFISYRQKDNRGGRQGVPPYGTTQSREAGWVSEFVEALKAELESTFKEDISIYFDVNPHDGLLETHDVGDSLKEKLKCLIFIPILSRTYCDPKSFAWEHEFIAFIDHASHDRFGQKVKLPNGNIASRILPVRIHDLDPEDIQLCESALGSILRGVEFIYKATGVNRPLRSIEEKPLDNLNRTLYRDQINKVANAIKEIITGLNAGPTQSGKGAEETRMPWEEKRKERSNTVTERPAGLLSRKLISYVISAVFVLVLLGIYAYPKVFRRDTMERLRASGEKISVVVMPFQNMTNDTNLNILQGVVQDNLINTLANSEELLVTERSYVTEILKSRGLTNYASIAPSLARKISQQLDTKYFIYGTISYFGNVMRFNAQLIDSKTNDIIKPFRIEGPPAPEETIRLIDSLSSLVWNYLVLSKMEKGVSRDLKPYTTKSLEAYKNFILANNTPGIANQIKYFSLAVNADSNFIPAIIFLSMRYKWQGNFEVAKKLCLKAYQIKDNAQTKERIMAEAYFADLFGTPNDQIKSLKEYLNYDDQLPVVYALIGNNYSVLLQYEKAITEYEKALEIYKKWQVKPMGADNYVYLGDAYQKTGKYREAKKIYKRAERDFPDSPSLIYKQAVLALSEGDTVEANKYIEKIRSVFKGFSFSEARIISALADIYSEAGVLDKAEKYFRHALSLEPNRSSWLFNLGWFLIDKDRNITEGLELFDRLLKLSPENYEYLDAIGWGLYKQGKYVEALEVLNKSWDLRREKAVYNHEAFLHLDAAKKAVAGMK